MKKILIRCDGGIGIGMGHVMRMITLAKELMIKYKVIFICRCNPKNKYEAGIEKIKKEGFEVLYIHSKNILEETKEIQKNEKADLLLTDSYDVNEQYFDELSNYFYKTAYMDDINSMRINTDLIINQNIGSEKNIYNHEPNKNTRLLLGTKYVLLRDEFKKTVHINKDHDELMITLGGSDEKFLTLKIIELLSDWKFRINVVVGNAFSDILISKLEEIALKNNNIVLYKNCIMSEVMKRSTMAISACGSTLYELSAMGIPTLGIVVADNQKDIALNMEKAGVIINTKQMIYDSPLEFKKDFNRFFNDYDLRKTMKCKSEKNFSTDGTKAVVEEIEKLLK